MATSLRLEAVAVRSESTYGVDPTPGATHAVRMIGRIWPALRRRHQFPNRRDDSVSGSLIPPKRGVAKGRLVDLELVWEMKGKGSAYAAEDDIEGNPLLKACGLAVAVSTTGGSESLTYTPADTGHGSCTIYGYAGGELVIIRGCRGNVRWPIRAGNNGTMIFSMTGMLISDPATTALLSATYDSQLPPAAVGMAFTLNPGVSYSPDLLDAELDLGNDVQIIEDGNGSDGLQGVEIPGRVPMFNCTIRQDVLASYNPAALFAAVTSHLIDWTLGGTQYNRFKLDINEAYLDAEPDHVDYAGFAGYRLSFGVHQLSLIAD